MYATKPASLAPVTAKDALIPWTTPECTGINRLPGRASLLPFASAEDARVGEKAFVRSLNGDWHFKLVARVADTPATFIRREFDASAWSTIAVPGNWTMQGHGFPHYTNIQMPFSPCVPPQVPQENPTGLYHTSFTVPKAWAKRRIVLHFGGVDSCFSVWVNGKPIGFGKDSRLPNEFDISSASESGANSLAVQVIKWSDGSYLEDQDHWWQAGIYRDVFIYATAPTWIDDVFAKAGFDPTTGAGTLAIDVRGGNLPAKGWTAEAQLFDARGKKTEETVVCGVSTWAVRANPRTRADSRAFDKPAKGRSLVSGIAEPLHPGRQSTQRRRQRDRSYQRTH